MYKIAILWEQFGNKTFIIKQAITIIYICICLRISMRFSRDLSVLSSPFQKWWRPSHICTPFLWHHFLGPSTIPFLASCQWHLVSRETEYIYKWMSCTKKSKDFKLIKFTQKNAFLQCLCINHLNTWKSIKLNKQEIDTRTVLSFCCFKLLASQFNNSINEIIPMENKWV